MLTLKSLRVRGFRGFLDTDAGDFDLASPITILFGQNARGKSSTLNAIEWDLFGNECSGKDTNIRERVNWIIANRHANPGKVSVELEIQDEDGIYWARRELRSRARRKASDGDVEIELPDGECLTGTQAAQFLERLHRSTFRDFATTVYQHQEAIRAIVTQEPRHRSEAIDRLLGLSEHRNLLDSINKVNAKGRLKDFQAKWDALRTQVQTALNSREKDLDELRNKAINAGVPRNQLNAKSALALARDVEQALDQFATETGLEPETPQAPHEWTGLESFYKEVRRSITSFRGELPAVKEQEELAERQTKVIDSKAELQSAKDRQKKIGENIRQLDKDHGSQIAVDEQLAKATEDGKKEKDQLREADSRAALINDAIDFLEAEQEKDLSSDLCPVCGNQAPDLLESLRQEWEVKLQIQSKQSREKIKALQTQEKRLRIAADEYKTWNDKMEAVKKDLVRVCKEIGSLLCRDIKAEDDPLALLNEEADKIERQLKRLVKAVKEKQDRLDQIEQELEKVRIIDNVLRLEEKREIIDQIEQSAEFEDSEKLLNRAAELVEDLERIREAISQVTHEEAREKLAAAEAAIDRYFRRLTEHPAVRAIKLTVETDTRTQRNDYAITDQEGKDLTPILSQGDLNALALAIFLGLAASTKGLGAFGFVLMDDPSQSLDSEHKKQLVQVLNEVAKEKQLVISTMDQEFRDCLATELTKAKTEYIFETWTPEEGPTITRM
jgi:exonuclease SbcC